MTHLPANAAEKRQQVLEVIQRDHLKPVADADGPVFCISKRYAGVWLEHVQDAVVWSRYCGDPTVALNHIGLFLKHQKPDGQLPMAVTLQDGPSYGQIQECVAFMRMCLETYEMCGGRAFLQRAYDAGCRWDDWLCRWRMTTGQGLIEMFCGYDTGHDNSGRLEGMKYPGKVSPEAPDARKLPEGCPVLPGIAPDMNAVFYGDRVALARMAELLGRPDEAAAWQQRAEQVRQRLYAVCFDPEDEFFYDVDKDGQMRRIRTIAITNVLCEGIADRELANRIFDRYLWNEREFKTPYPFPAVSIADPRWRRNLSGNSWGYYSQAMTVLRATRWMPGIGRREELRQVLRIWVERQCAIETVPFGQELDPISGEPSDASPWFSAAELLFLVALQELERED